MTFKCYYYAVRHERCKLCPDRYAFDCVYPYQFEMWRIVQGAAKRTP